MRALAIPEGASCLSSCSGPSAAERGESSGESLWGASEVAEPPGRPRRAALGREVRVCAVDQGAMLPAGNQPRGAAEDGEPPAPRAPSWGADAAASRRQISVEDPGGAAFTANFSLYLINGGAGKAAGTSEEQGTPAGMQDGAHTRTHTQPGGIWPCSGDRLPAETSLSSD